MSKIKIIMQFSPKQNHDEKYSINYFLFVLLQLYIPILGDENIKFSLILLVFLKFLFFYPSSIFLKQILLGMKFKPVKDSIIDAGNSVIRLGMV